MNPVQPTVALATATAGLLDAFHGVDTAEQAAAVLTCRETDALAAVFRAAGAPDTAKLWITEHIANSSECQGHDADAAPQDDAALLYDAQGNYNPAPGTEYPFSVSDIARATARLLGAGWTAESGYWGTTGVVCGPFTATFGFLVDDEGDLCIAYDNYPVDGFPESPDLPDQVGTWDVGVYLEEAAALDGLDDLAERAAAAIRAITGYNPDDFDFQSSASRQHHIDTGRYLRKGEAEEA
ncbi:hypothetical protein QJ054_33585 [Streptomyces sp. AN-3]|uniref:hypothetical protein n=1 Tax=Streptomyces sp. AN-3 TaxID=3044177 RepID=UPI00249A49B9|nr:hypothetical protein [Streptomyces sp. AN-3]MDI3101969.1 hypothetical protein [Streptomyces sp. AN-3]